MGASENSEYSVTEDEMMYELHELRKAMAKEGIDPKKLKSDAEIFLTQNKIELRRLIVTSPKE